MRACLYREVLHAVRVCRERGYENNTSHFLFSRIALSLPHLNMWKKIL